MLMNNSNGYEIYKHCILCDNLVNDRYYKYKSFVLEKVSGFLFLLNF